MRLYPFRLKTYLFLASILIIIPVGLLFLKDHKIQEVHAILPNGFSKTQIATGLSSPTDFALAPDGRIFITEKAGSVVVMQNGLLLSQPFITLPVNAQDERGLLGIALDPDFETNHYIYLFYVNNSPLEIHVSRFTEANNQAVSGSEVILLKSTQTLGLAHMSGTLRFGPDGKLWISVGNNIDTAPNSQDLSNIHGKILRINKDGSIPSDNPFVNTPGADPAIWAYGLRNPFRFNFQPNGLPMIADVGDATYEWIFRGVPGGDYGYPFTADGGPCAYPNEANNPNCPYIQPLFEYPHNGKSSAVVGGFFYSGSQFPAEYQNSYFYGDYARGFIHRLTFDSKGNFAGDQVFDNSAGTVVELLPDGQGNFYYLTISPGVLYKVSFNSASLPPIAKSSANQTSGTVPFTVNFSSNGSSDPNNNPLTYAWNFGDGITSSLANPSHTYTTAGVYSVTLSVSNGTSSTAASPLQIAAGFSYPAASITTPTDGTTYNDGQQISYSGSATDSLDGTLPASAYSWTILYHNNSLVQIVATSSGAMSGTFTIPTTSIPNTGEPSINSSYEIDLTVTNSHGLQTTVTKTIQPNIANITFATSPANLGITVNGVPQTTPYTIQSVVGYKWLLNADSVETLNGTNYQFSSWSDNGAQLHEYQTPSSDSTVTANFQSTGQGTGTLELRVREMNSSGAFDGNYVNGATVKLTDQAGNVVYQTQTSQNVNGQDGWATFNNVLTGTYGLMAYESGYQGVWEQGGCNSSGSTNTINNPNTATFIAAWDSPVTISSNQIAWCHDLGLQKNNLGNLYFRIPFIQLGTQAGYSVINYINGAIVKLTDTLGQIVYQATTSGSSNGQDGWVFLNNIPAGNYGLLAYAPGYDGYMNELNCVGAYTMNSYINNQNTDGSNAAWNPNITVMGGVTTFCNDLGLTQQFGRVMLRIREFNTNGATGNYLNGVTVKLLDPSGQNKYQVATSSAILGQDGWVILNNVPGGATYGIVAYENGYQGVWKQAGCTGSGTTTNATATNSYTQGNIAAWDNNVSVTTNETTWCHDLGLELIPTSGEVQLRVHQLDSNGKDTGNFMNGVTVKLLDTTGNTVVQTATTSAVNNQDGWVTFENVPAGNYGVAAYEKGYQGLWEQGGCSGPTNNATITNSNTDGLTAAWDNTVSVALGQISWCHDLGLNQPANVGTIGLRIRNVTDQGAPYGNYINGATVKLTDKSGATVYQTINSANLNGQDGWVFFSNVTPGTYGVMAYLAGDQGVFKQGGCVGEGTTEDDTINNQNTNGLIAAWDNAIVVVGGQISWCHDLGLSTLNPVTPTPTPTITPSVTPTPSGVSSTQINNITPATGNYGDSVTINGSGFGTSQGSVQVFTTSGQAVGGAPIQSWSDTQIKTTLPTFGSNTDYLVAVVRSDNTMSNKVTYHCVQGQPQFSDANAITPSGGYNGTSITITGRQFGSAAGSISFYDTYPHVVATGTITSWTDTQIVFTIPSALAPDTQYALDITASTGSKSEIVFYTTGH